MSDTAPRQRTWSVYVHFPWCLKRCAYCDFATTVAETIPREDYTQAILRELDLRTTGLTAAPIATVFFGGGTPSLWGASHVARVLDALHRWGGLCDDAEVTLEANPGAAEAGELADYTAAGVNRISIGVQALDDRRLRALDRLHNAAAAQQTLAHLAALLASGRLHSCSADLIFGAPGQDLQALRDDVAGVTAFGLPHLSAYALTVEEGTPLAVQIARKQTAPPDDDLQADMLQALPGWLAAAGLQHYEVSNFARPGHRARHNMVYWQGGHWLALGVGAHGHVPTPHGDVRYGNSRHTGTWLKTLAQGALAESQRETIDAATLLVERLLTGLRLREGVDLEALRRDAGATQVAALERRVLALRSRESALHWQGDRLWLEPTAWPRLDGVLRALT